MKQILVMFPWDESARENLLEAVGDRARCIFRDPDWTEEEYHRALGSAHIIIGEPKNRDFQHCKNLELMQSPSSGVNYYVQGGAFPPNAILCSMTGCYGSLIAEHILSLVLALCRRLRCRLWKMCWLHLPQSTARQLPCLMIGRLCVLWR